MQKIGEKINQGGEIMPNKRTYQNVLSFSLSSEIERL